MNSPVITPTVGRKVWFRLNGIPQLARAGVEQYTPAAPSNNGAQPFDATVVYVWDDRMVNLLVLDHYGNPFTATSVPLLQPGDVTPSAGFYAEWMPYQQGQARKEAASNLPPHQQRVIDEKAARDGEVSRLAAFIDSNPVFSQLPADEQARLRRQLDVMRELSVILGERIAHF